MTTSEGRLVDSRRLARTIILAGEQVKSDFAQVAAQFNLPLPSARALLVLAEPTPMRDLAEQLICEPSYVTGLADQLEARGLITRVPGKDRRVKLLAVTEAGSTLREQISDALAQRAIIESRLNDDERAELTRLLGRLIDPETANAAKRSLHRPRQR